MMDFSMTQWAAIWAVVAAAYVVFGMAGFGTALMAGPVLTQLMPLSRVVPLLALLDFSAAVTNLLRDGRRADVAELKRLLPWMLLGSGVGAAVLLKTRPEVLLLMLGIFAVAYALQAMLRRQARKTLPATFAVPFGLVGGVFSALFGSGGFLYAIYLAGRLEDKERLRVTQSTLIGLSTLARLLIFLMAGVYHDSGLLLLAAVLLPAMWGGLWLGRHITLRLTREQFLRILHGIVLASGLALLARYFF
ncbi:sulfite exporter TauE/SafE family protein [Vandammella animalimorsus]|uniref:Probable membrane transporter protein n=2 Tax=Vandammella animalimorsus TaxID=2029117 RepID=A0A3M6R8M1_9BURK|nr:sulfite exporter TauE/SafE family protein [Vandammella animalimorsus]